MRRFPGTLWVMLMLALVAPPAQAQTDTTGVALIVTPHQQACFYNTFISLGAIDSTATYETAWFPVADMATSGMVWYAEPSADTVGVDIQVSNDGATWQTLGLTATDSLTTGAWVTSTNTAILGSRYARFSVGYPAGSVGVATLGVKVPLATGVTGSTRSCYTLPGAR
jgi:hypothetical protein